MAFPASITIIAAIGFCSLIYDDGLNGCIGEADGEISGRRERKDPWI